MEERRTKNCPNSAYYVPYLLACNLNWNLNAYIHIIHIYVCVCVACSFLLFHYNTIRTKYNLLFFSLLYCLCHDFVSWLVFCFIFRFVFFVDCRCAVKQSKPKHHHHHIIQYNGPFVAKMYYYLCICTSTSTSRKCTMAIHTYKHKTTIQKSNCRKERKFCMMRIQSHFDMHSIFICVLLYELYTRRLIIYFIRWYFFCRIPIPSAFLSFFTFFHSFRVRLSFSIFQFNLKCALCMNRKFSIIIVMISLSLFRLLAWSFCFILYIVIKSCERIAFACVCVYAWYDYNITILTVPPF